MNSRVISINHIVLLMGLILASAVPAHGAERPNIVVILSDDGPYANRGEDLKQLRSSSIRKAIEVLSLT